MLPDYSPLGNSFRVSAILVRDFAMSSRCHLENLSRRLAWGIIVAIGLAVIVGSSPGRSDEKLVKMEDTQFWAFRKPAKMQPAAVRTADRVRTPVDRFVLAELEEQGLTLSPDADPVTFVRRAYLDLIGLPPAPDEVDAFLADTEPDASDRLVGRLLMSSHFGERWGRHWLDVVGYTDTVGFDIDAALIIQSEGKWRYRDYVSHSFNADKPYDRFVTEQLAGDELVDWRNTEKFTPEIRELLVATGFLRTAQDYTHEPESNIPLNHFAVLHDTLEIVGSSLLGLTLNCARCHDHKFDPIPQEDYYRLMALFTPAYNPNDWKAVTPYKPGIQDRALPDVSAAERAAIERHNAEIDAKIIELNQPLAELRRPYEQRLLEMKLAAIPEPIRADTRSAIETPADKRNEIQKYLASKFAASLKVSIDEVVAALNDTDKATNARIGEQITTLNRQRQSFGKLQALFDIGPPPTTHLLVRGNHETPGPAVPPGFLTMRNDRTAYVAASDDGLHFGPVKRWRFDDGSDLGSTNTQQHWVTHSDGVLLSYTRKGANNDHVFRHRAPLFIAQVDPEKLQVIRSTEQILIPERGAGLGNAFGVTEVNANETWVTTAEWMQGPKGILMPGNQYGSDNRIYAARILWKKPNHDWDTR